MSKNETQDVKKPVPKRMYQGIQRVISEGHEPLVEMSPKEFINTVKYKENQIPEDKVIEDSKLELRH